ncbi:hypothetical protein [Pseudoclavibacter helvolus]|uniref:hypothetical protein n=1 Tax=Pseudoclavibacter helvolus TaxID=255205 RepID=UPI0035E5AD5A
MTEACSSWLCWEGWEFVGVVLSALGLLAVVFAVFELHRASKRAPAVQLTVDVIGRASVPDVGVFHTLVISNLGTGSCDFMFAHLVGARAHLTADYRLTKQLGPGESQTVLVTAEKLERAWIRFAYRSTSEWDTMRFVWFPLTVPGAMADQLDEDVDRFRENSVRLWFRQQRLRYGTFVVPVRPGAFHRAALPLGRKATTGIRAIFDSDSTSKVYELTPTGRNVRDLPVVDLDAV